MTITLRQIVIGLAIHAALGPAALAVMPPYTSYAGNPPCGAESSKSQAVSNEDVLQALQENKKLMQELLQRLETLQISSAALKSTR